jgi:DNA-binding beta-propeller fold protein YncE
MSQITFAISFAAVFFSSFIVREKERSVLEGQDSTATSDRTVVVDFTYGNFLNAASMSSAPDGGIFVLDEGNDKLMKFDSKGLLEKNIGGKGWGNLEFDQPTDVCASFPLNIYVADYNNHRVEVFDRKLNFIQSITDQNLPASYSGEFYPRACAISSQGELFIVETQGRRILKFDQNQVFQNEFGSYSAGAGALSDPLDITISPSDSVFVLDAHRVVCYDIFGNYLFSFTLYSSENPEAISSNGQYIVVTFPSAIEVFLSDGTRQYEIPSQQIIGLPSHNEFRDALEGSSNLLILTNHQIVVGQPGP